MSPRYRIPPEKLKTWQRITLLVIALLVLASRCAVPAATGDQIVASINKQIVTLRDLDYFIVEQQLYNKRLKTLPLSELRKGVLSSVLEEYLLSDWAEMHIEAPDDSTIDRTMERSMERYINLAGGREQFLDLLEEYEVSLGKFRKWAKEASRRRLMIRHAILMFAEDVPRQMPDGTIAEATQIQLAHIFFQASPGATKEEILERALQVRRDIEAGLPFSEAARLFSEDNETADEGGELGWFRSGDLNDQIWTTAKELRPGEVSEPVETQQGFHLINVLDFRTNSQEEFRKAMQAEERKRISKLWQESDIRISKKYQGSMSIPEETVDEAP